MIFNKTNEKGERQESVHQTQLYINSDLSLSELNNGLAQMLNYSTNILLALTKFFSSSLFSKLQEYNTIKYVVIANEFKINYIVNDLQ